MIARTLTTFAAVGALAPAAGCASTTLSDEPMANTSASDTPVPAALQTVAERSGYTSTATYDQTIALCSELDRRSDLVSLSFMGETAEGRRIPLLIVGDPPHASAANARRDGKLVVLLVANIHAGEVCGKEAFPMLVRDLILRPGAPENRAILRTMTLLVVPIYNADGNERFSPGNRPGQVGPVNGMGQRANAQGLDLNRDYIKARAPETRAMLDLLTRWNPDLIVDSHTTNGSYIRYALTYAAPQNPAGHFDPMLFVRDTMLPEVERRMKERTGYDTFFYGNLNRERTEWETYDALPRFGGNYHGLRNRMSVLLEAYSYASYENRVLATLEFTREVLGFAAERAEDIRILNDRAERETVEKGRAFDENDRVPIRSRIAAFPRPVTILAYEEPEDRRAMWESVVASAMRNEVPDLGAPIDLEVAHLGKYEPTLSVVRPLEYAIPPGHDAVIDTLRAHGLVVEPVTVPRVITAEVYAIDEVTRAEREFQGVRGALVEATPRRIARTIGEGWIVVRLSQPLGTLAVYLLEPGSDDGLAHWGFFDDGLAPGSDFPILRVVN
ncbi:MAG: M14 family metallopeptidase [Phycisphaerales bacterium]